MSAGSNIALFAPPQTGMTEFVRKDVARLAEQWDAVVVYVDFGANEWSPAAAVYQGVAEAVDRCNTLGRHSLSLPELDIPEERNTDFEADLIHYCFDGILKKLKMPVVLIMDGIDQLALRTSNLSFTRALRSHIQSHREWIYSIYTGSSMELLRKTFNDIKAPFFQEAVVGKLPLLDEGFVAHIVEQAKKYSVDSLNFQGAIDMFNSCGHHPGIFIEKIRVKSE